MRRSAIAVSGTLVIGALLVSMAFGLRTPIARAAQPAAAAAPVADAGKAAELASAVQIEPEALAKMLAASKGEKPVVLHVGFKNFYDQAKIPGSDYAGPGSKPEGLELLRKHVSALQHSSSSSSTAAAARGTSAQTPSLPMTNCTPWASPT